MPKGKVEDMSGKLAPIAGVSDEPALVVEAPILIVVKVIGSLEDEIELEE